MDLARRTVDVITNQYKAGTVNYLNVVTAQTTALADERTAVGILGNRMTNSVLLISALGGGWDTTLLPEARLQQSRPLMFARRSSRGLTIY